MLFAYLDDGTLEVMDDITAARRAHESEDVESGTVRFFDARGNPLVPRFPSRTERRFLGIRVSEDPGPFDLVPSDDAGSEKLADALGPVSVMMPNRWFTTLDAVRAHLEGV